MVTTSNFLFCGLLKHSLGPLCIYLRIKEHNQFNIKFIEYNQILLLMEMDCTEYS